MKKGAKRPPLPFPGSPLPRPPCFWHPCLTKHFCPCPALPGRERNAVAGIAWSPSLSLGVKSIDEEHQHLLALANALILGVRKNDGQAIAKAFHELRKYTVTHFANEEHYMHRMCYPKLGAHRQEHARLKLQVKHFQDTLYRKGGVTKQEVVEFMKQWLIEHVLRVDMQIRDFLAEQR